MPDRSDLARYRAYLQEEVDSASLYRAIAAIERDERLAEVFRRLAETEEAHAAFWEDKLRAAGAPVPPRTPGRRSRILAWLARRFGPQVILSTLAAAERNAGSGYADHPESRATAMPGEERSHARVLRTLAGTTNRGVEGSLLARLEGRHRLAGGNALRAAVLGANDGLVSNLSLVMGVAGAQLSGDAILLAGLAGLLAGSSSMAMGEWLSVQSSLELYERQIAIEAEEIEAVPAEEAEELALIYQAKGIPEDQARELADRLMSDRDTALDTLAREELGIDPAELGGSAKEAAATSFALFAIGAIVPVAPFFFLQGSAAVATRLAISALALFLIGAGITLLTGRSVLHSGMRQLLIGTAAAATTFLIGRLLGVAVAG